MFAGPNGSGKSTLKAIIDPALLGHYLNADDIEKRLADLGRVDLAPLGFEGDAEEAVKFLAGSGFLKEAGINIGGQRLRAHGTELLATPGLTNSYLASVLVEFLRAHFVERRQSFTFETVMSHPSKVEALKSARAAGFRTCLYFVGTEDADINVARVAERVRRGGHDVSAEKVRERYARTMALLPQAVRASDRAYIFDNSAARPRLVAEVTDGKEVRLHLDTLPLWIVTYLLAKK